MTVAASDQPPVALVTGSSRGLGRGAAIELAARGFSVAVHYAGNLEAARETIAQCQLRAISPGQTFAPVQGNLASSKDRENLVAGTLNAFGRVDALVNNAGMAPRVRADILDATEESFDEVLSVNLRGPYFLTQAVARHWMDSGYESRIPGGFKIVFVTSISANTASVSRGEYCISKAGLGMAAQLWAVRLAAHGVQVYEVRPGIMLTDMTAGVKEKYDALIAEGLVPQQRWGDPRDVGLAVASLLQGGFPFSTGAVVPLDGGLTILRL